MNHSVLSLSNTVVIARDKLERLVYLIGDLTHPPSSLLADGYDNGIFFDPGRIQKVAEASKVGIPYNCLQVPCPYDDSRVFLFLDP